MGTVTISLTVTRVFSVVLVLVGIVGFVVPADAALTSGAPAYNVFHLVFGFIGLGCALSKQPSAAKAFNFGFGLIDLYQALASFMHWWPESLFRWTRVDDVLHVVIGAALVGVALLPAEPRSALAR